MKKTPIKDLQEKLTKLNDRIEVLTKRRDYLANTIAIQRSPFPVGSIVTYWGGKARYKVIAIEACDWNEDDVALKTRRLRKDGTLGESRTLDFIDKVMLAEHETSAESK